MESLRLRRYVALSATLLALSFCILWDSYESLLRLVVNSQLFPLAWSGLIVFLLTCLSTDERRFLRWRGTKERRSVEFIPLRGVIDVKMIKGAWFLVGRDKAQKLKKRGERHVSLVPTLDTLANVIENDVCALSMSYLFASKTRGFDRIVRPVRQWISRVQWFLLKRK